MPLAFSVPLTTSIDRLPVQRPPRAGRDEREAGADSGRLDGGEDAGVDAADGHDDDAQDPGGARGGPQALPPRHGRAGVGRLVRVAADDDPDREHEEQRERDPGHDSGHEQAADALLGDDAVDDESRGGRDEDAERAAGGDGAGRQRVVVAEPPHLGQRHAAHRERGGQRRAGKRRESGAGDDRRGRETAPDAAEPTVGRAVQVLTHPGDHGQVPHQHEQRQDGEGIARGDGEGLARQHGRDGALGGPPRCRPRRRRASPAPRAPG